LPTGASRGDGPVCPNYGRTFDQSKDHYTPLRAYPPCISYHGSSAWPGAAPFCGPQTFRARVKGYVHPFGLGECADVCRLLANSDIFVPISPRCLSTPNRCDKPRNVSNFGARHHWRGSSAHRGRVKPGWHCPLFNRVWGSNICRHKCDHWKRGAAAPAGDGARGKLGGVQDPELWTGCGGARFRRGLPGAAPLLEKWRSFTVYSHSSEILTFPGDPLRGTALVAARFC